MDLDLTGVGQLVLDLLGDVAREQHHLILRDLLGLDHDANLAAGLNGIAVGDAGKALGDFLKLFKTLDVVLDILATRTGARGGDSVRRLHDAGDDRVGLNIAVVRLDGVDNGLRFLVLSCDVDADGDVAALDLMVDGLAEVVQEACALGRSIDAPSSAAIRPGEVGDLDGVVEHILAVTGAVLHAAEQLDDLGMQAMDIRLENTRRARPRP